jgi:hypothetical protein
MVISANDEEFWASEIERYRLVRVRKDESEKGLMVYDLSVNGVVILDDDDYNLRVVRRMIEAGVPIVEDIAELG